MRTLLWFRRNLRVHDQPLFRVDEAAVGVWILDPREIMATDPAGFPFLVLEKLETALEKVKTLYDQRFTADENFRNLLRAQQQVGDAVLALQFRRVLLGVPRNQK